MNTTELLNQAADLIERDGWRPADDRFDARYVSNAIYQVWREGWPVDRLASGVFPQSIEAVEEVIGVADLNGLWQWNDHMCLDQAEAVNTIRKAAENVEGRKR